MGHMLAHELGERVIDGRAWKWRQFGQHPISVAAHYAIANRVALLSLMPFLFQLVAHFKDGRPTSKLPLDNLDCFGRDNLSLSGTATLPLDSIDDDLHELG